MNDNEYRNKTVINLIRAQKLKWLRRLWRSGTGSKIKEIMDWQPGRKKTEEGLG